MGGGHETIAALAEPSSLLNSSLGGNTCQDVFPEQVAAPGLLLVRLPTATRHRHRIQSLSSRFNLPGNSLLHFDLNAQAWHQMLTISSNFLKTFLFLRRTFLFFHLRGSQVENSCSTSDMHSRVVTLISTI